MNRNAIHDPYLVFHADLKKHDGASFTSDDAYGHLCTVTGATWGMQGRSFDIAHDDIITIPDSTNWNIGASDFTIIVWAKHSELGVVHPYLTQAVSNDFYWFFRKQADNTIIFTYKNGDNLVANRVNVAGTNTLSINTFYQLAVTKIGITYQLYINGFPEPSPITQSVSNSDFAHTLQIGGYPDLTANTSIYGIIGEVLLYLGKGLTQAEISKML